jgi:hypothetical protein
MVLPFSNGPYNPHRRRAWPRSRPPVPRDLRPRGSITLHYQQRHQPTQPSSKPPGCPKKLDDRIIRRVIRRASEGSTSSSRLKADFDLPVAARTIRRILEETDFLVFSKMEQTIELTAEHKAMRLAFAKLHLESGTDWKGTLFSDEKKFNRDSPDGFEFSWTDVRRDSKKYNKPRAVGVSCLGAGFVGRVRLNL